MRSRLVHISLGVFPLLVFVILGNARADDLPSVVVFDFENNTDKRKRPFGRQVADLLSSNLAEASLLRVVSRAELAAALPADDATDGMARGTSGPRSVGELVGADYVVTGAIAQWEKRRAKTKMGGFRMANNTYFAIIDAKIVETQSGTVQFSETGVGEVTTSRVKIFGIGGREEDGRANLMQALRSAVADLASSIESSFAPASVASEPGESTTVSAE